MNDSSRERPSPPLGLLAELTHRCPLGCPYCSNPVDLENRRDELDAATWARVFTEASALGVLQVHLSGGEPASRRDLLEIVAACRSAGLYSNLITSGVGLTEASITALREGGLDHVQLSIQDCNEASADHIAGYLWTSLFQLGYGLVQELHHHRAPEAAVPVQLLQLDESSAVVV